MMAWFLSNEFNLELSTEKLLKYGLAHDLIEVYAGDTPAYSQDKNVHESKKEREEKALERIKIEFSHFKELLNTIETYEKKVDEESVFVYEIDKIVPALNLYLDDGYGWNKLELTLEQIKKEKRSKVKNVNELVDLLEETLERFEKEEGKLFTLKSS
jgi:putative hydrolase of HD superfamily